MPNQRVQYGGPTLVAGTFRGDDDVLATGLLGVTQHEAVHVDGGLVQIDAHNLEGTVVITHDFGQQGNDVLLAKDNATGEATFQMTKTGDMYMRGTLLCVSMTAPILSQVADVSGSAFSH